MPSISIALCTFNGESFLGDLLESLVNQSQQPSELIVCDDVSSDQTLHLLQNFSQRAPFPIRVQANPYRRGIVKNFEQAIGLCSGDIIALCDQDDVWHPNKLFLLSQALTPPSSLAVFSDATVVNETLHPLGYSMWQRVHFHKSEQKKLAAGQGFDVLLKHSVVTGATLAFKTRLRDTAIPIPENWQHDYWLGLVASAQGEMHLLQSQLILYRQHGANAVGGQRKSFFQEMLSAFDTDRSAWYRDQLDAWLSLQSRLSSTGVNPRVETVLADKIAHLEARAQLPAQRRRRYLGIWRELMSGRYHRFARNWGSVAFDLLLK